MIACNMGELQPTGSIERLSVAVLVDDRRVVADDGTVTTEPLNNTELEEVTRLVREAVTLSGLEGLGVPRVVAFGSLDGGRRYLVRELVDGVSLAAALVMAVGAVGTALLYRRRFTAIILLPVYFAAVILLAERMALVWRLIRRWRTGGKTRNVERQLNAERDAVVEAVLTL